MGKGDPICILDETSKDIIITKHHTKFQPLSSKSLEEIPLWKKYHFQGWEGVGGGYQGLAGFIKNLEETSMQTI